MNNNVDGKAETREEAFIRIGEQRVNKLLDMIKKLSNLSNKSAYSYTDEQVDKMFKTLEDALKDSKKAFASKRSNKKFNF